MDQYILPLVVVGKGATFIQTLDPHEAALAQDVLASQWRYVHGTGSPQDLFGWLGMRIAGHLVETDPDVLDELARRGDFDLAETYRAMFG